MWMMVSICASLLPDLDGSHDERGVGDIRAALGIRGELCLGRAGFPLVDSDILGETVGDRLRDQSAERYALAGIGRLQGESDRRARVVFRWPCAEFAAITLRGGR